MKHSKYQQQIGVNEVCTKRTSESTNRIGQRYIKWDMKDCFLFESWLSSKKLAEAVMEYGDDLIVMIKINPKVLCKDTIENFTKDSPEGYYLVLRRRPMVSGGRLVIAIDCKYNVRKVLSFIVTYNSGIIQAGLPYLSKYPDQFYNVVIHPFARTLFMYKFF